MAAELEGADGRDAGGAAGSGTAGEFAWLDPLRGFEELGASAL
jgi:hypothetical protein